MEYLELPSVNEVLSHIVGEFVKELLHANGIESFWSMLEWGFTGDEYQLNQKYLN